jgi:serine/threonine-protein kinase
MGVILKGRDNDLGRDLAVKVLLERHGGNPELLRRFVEEAQIAGQLQHPGVVPVYELGAFADRRPYFAMKLVKGRTLAEVMDERPDPSSDHPRLLAIFLDVAQTIAYAHARGVIHRDLKPSNIMVGSFGEVQVMDWGLAKVLPRGGVVDDANAGKLEVHETVIATARSGSDSGSDLSRAGSVLGTPAYMAPEQARGENDRLDERADVFALGSILCEILTGQPAFIGRSSGEILRQAAQGDLSGAWKRLDACGADAELMALARDCLMPEVDDRPHHAGVVVDRLASHLAGVQERLRAAELARAAESARAESAKRAADAAEARARAERRARRLIAALAASVLVLATVTGLGAATYLQQRQARATAVARSLGEAETLLARAVASPEDPARWREAEAAASRVDPSQVVDAAGQARLARIRSDAAAGLNNSERDAVLRQDLVEIRASENDVGAAGTDAAYAEAFREAGLDLDALDVAEASTRLHRRSAAIRLELATFLDHWALVRFDADRPLADRLKLLNVARSADPDPFRDRVREILTKGNEAKTEDLESLAGDPRLLGDLAAPTAVYLARALGRKEAGFALLRETVSRHPDDVWANFTLAWGLDLYRPDLRLDAVRYYGAARALRPETSHSLAHCLEQLGRGDEAEATFHDLVARRPENTRNLTCFGKLLKDRGRSDEANDVLDKAIVAGRMAISRRPGEATAHFNLGYALMTKGMPDEASAEYREAIRIKPGNAPAYHNLAIVLSGLGKPDEAIAAFREAIRLRPGDAESHGNLAVELAKRGQQDEAIAEYRQVIRLEPDNARAHHNLAVELAKRGLQDEAIAGYHEAIRLRPDDALAHRNLAIALTAQGKQDEAIAEYREAIRIEPNNGDAHYNIGVLLVRQGKRDEAVAEYHEAIRLKPAKAEAHCNLGQILYQQGHPDEAIAKYREAIRISPDLFEAHVNLANALRAQGHPGEAIAEYRETIRLKPGDAGVHNDLALILAGQGKSDDAIAEYREAIRINPDLFPAHYNLGNLLNARGKLDEAIAEYREAIRIRPDMAEAHCNLGLRLKKKGDYAGALAELRRGHELGSRRPNWGYPSVEWVRVAERSLELAGRLPAVLKAIDKPRNADEGLIFAELCKDRSLYAASARLWEDALAADPKLAEDRELERRFSAACVATLAGCGHGEDDPAPDAEARRKLRQNALDWLKSELVAWKGSLEGASADRRRTIIRGLNRWKEDSDLSGIHEDAGLDKLPEPERDDWRALWAEVDALILKARAR